MRGSWASLRPGSLDARGLRDWSQGLFWARKARQCVLDGIQAAASAARRRAAALSALRHGGSGSGGGGEGREQYEAVWEV